jgi:DNA-binding NarL/FixJ family response regulator
MDRSTERNRTRVAVIDDHPLILEGTSHCLEKSGDIEIVGIATSASRGLNVIASERPDVAILDLQLPDANGVDLVREIRTAYPAISLLILTVHDEPGYLRRLMKLGIRGYLHKSASCEELIAATRAVAEGRTVFMLESTGIPLEDAQERLTPREEEVLQCLAEGHSNAEIAGDLTLSQKTVEFHISHILQKLGARSRAQAIVKGRQLGISS